MVALFWARTISLYEADTLARGRLHEHEPSDLVYGDVDHALNHFRCGAFTSTRLLFKRNIRRSFNAADPRTIGPYNPLPSWPIGTSIFAAFPTPAVTCHMHGRRLQRIRRLSNTIVDK